MNNQKIEWHHMGALILASAVVYAATYWVTDNMTEWFAFSFATSWVFIPAGVRMLLTLILLESGAVGVSLGTIWIDYQLHHSLDHFYNEVTACIAGGSAYISTLIAQRLFHLQSNLSQLNVTKLFGVSAVYSIVSPLMHQTWYVWQGKTEHFWPSLGMMSIGDFLGTLIVLGAIQWLLRGIKKLA